MTQVIPDYNVHGLGITAYFVGKGRADLTFWLVQSTELILSLNALEQTLLGLTSIGLSDTLLVVRALIRLNIVLITSVLPNELFI